MQKNSFIVIIIAISIATCSSAWESSVNLNLGDDKAHIVKTYCPTGNGLNFYVDSSGFSSAELRVNGIGCYYNPQKVEIVSTSCASKTCFVITYKVKDTGIVCSEILDLEDEDFTKYARADIKKSYSRENGSTKGFDEIPMIVKIGRITFQPYAG